MILYICGHLDLTVEEFNKHYAPQLVKFLGHWNIKHHGSYPTVLVGDASGCDTMVQEYFDMAIQNQYFLRDKLIVYHMLKKPRNNVGNFRTIGGFISDAERDSAMIEEADEILAYIKPGREKSGTARNILNFYTIGG